MHLKTKISIAITYNSTEKLVFIFYFKGLDKKNCSESRINFNMIIIMFLER